MSDNRSAEQKMTESHIPPRLAVDANGYCWRVYPEHWSMARTNPDNEPIPEPITYYEPVGSVDWKATARQYHDWLYAIWMAFLADEETHELQTVLGNLSETMQENERP